MKRTVEDAAKTRVALLQAALMAFEELGWRGATFEEVSARAGVTRGALHHHFRDKTALLREALEWGWSEYAGRLFDTTDPAASDAQLTAVLTEYVRLLADEPLFRALAVTTVVVAPQAFPIDAAKRDGLDTWHTHLTEMIGSPAESSIPAEQIAGLVLVLIQGFTVAAATRPNDLPQPPYRDAAIAAIVRGLLS